VREIQRDAVLADREQQSSDERATPHVGPLHVNVRQDLEQHAEQHGGHA
jgi:hypothetical protein